MHRESDPGSALKKKTKLRVNWDQNPLFYGIGWYIFLGKFGGTQQRTPPVLKILNEIWDGLFFTLRKMEPHAHHVQIKRKWQTDHLEYNKEYGEVHHMYNALCG